MQKRVPKVKQVCETCGKEFMKYPSAPTRFCSMKCYGVAERHGSMLTCAHCGKEFYRRYGEQDRDVRINSFCSQACYTMYRRARMKPTTYTKTKARHLHRVIAEKLLGRKLLKNEVVHHINGNKHDNRPENLMVLESNVEHARLHFRKNYESKTAITFSPKGEIINETNLHRRPIQRRKHH